MPKNCPMGKLESDACFECLCNFGGACTYRSLEEKEQEREQARKYFKNKFIEDLNLILKDNFDFVPLEKTINIAEELFKKGWVKNVN